MVAHKIRHVHKDNENAFIKQADATLSDAGKSMLQTAASIEKTSNATAETLTNVGEAVTKVEQHFGDATGSWGTLAESLGKNGKKLVTMSAPLFKVATMGIGTYVLTTVVNTGMGIWKGIRFVSVMQDIGKKTGDSIVAGEKALEGFSEKVGDAAVTGSKAMEIFSEKVGESALISSNAFAKTCNQLGTSIENTTQTLGKVSYQASDDFSRISTSCQIVSLTIAAAASLAALTYFRSASCSMDPDSVFCSGPSLRTVVLIAGGLLAYGCIKSKYFSAQSQELTVVDPRPSEYWEQREIESKCRFERFNKHLANIDRNCQDCK